MANSHCLENPLTLTPTCGAETVQVFGRLNTYVTGPSDSKLAILLISDVFGYEAPLFRKLADKVAAAGFLVVTPDFFYGYEDAKPVIAALRRKGVSAIGAAGFCWGDTEISSLASESGKMAVQLASSDDIQAAVLLHPGRMTDDEVNGKIPVAILGAEIDHATPPEQVKHFGEILSSKSEIDCLVKVFFGVSHGWSVRYNIEDESAVKSAEEAHENMLNWFTKHVK
ncbi:hypothetical protein Pint_24933 [Pistacia integerrima]|uniref:Uncharacterized protein n=1 Tax=Pistacia integerrima TaxID=434235 RepID=A0ACC0YD07_9ROSI|nr:hypothetical protein Pint_24933 [Pistacia integerrima]